MEDILENQEQLVAFMEQQLKNFKKDSSDRKTPSNIERRLQTLKSYWEEFHSNHLQLNKFEDSSSSYFSDDVYQKTRSFYTQARETLEAYLATVKTKLGQQSPSLTVEESSLRPPSPLPGTSSADGDVVEQKSSKPIPKITFRSQGTNSKLDELMKKQSSNFKAFSRTVANIKVDLISQKWEFEDTLKRLEARWSVIDTLHWELDGELDQEDSSYEEIFSSHEKVFNQMKKSLNNKLCSVSHRHEFTPKMEIPIFHGNYQQWVSFKDLFMETIHNNPSLSNAQKMQFLKNKVKGEAESLIQHLKVSSENYSTGWEILNHRYNNQKLIFNSYVRNMMNIPIMQQPSLSSIKRMHDTTVECLNAIKNLGVDVSSWDPLVVYILSNKLDCETYKDYNECLKQPRELAVLSEFLQFLENKFTSMESSRHKQEHQKPSVSNSKTSKDVSFNKNYHKQSTYSSNKTTSESSIGKKFQNKTCPLCKNGHRLYQCEQFSAMSPMIKRQTVSKLSLCENCLYNHNGKDCISTRRCRECNGYHNTILHEAFAQSTLKSESLAVTKHEAAHTSTEQAQQFHMHVAQQREIPEILLATAEIKVQKLDGSYLTMRALIDQGSQTSLITENAAQQLLLPRQRCKNIITGIGVKDNSCKGVININCASTYGSYTFHTDVYIMKHLTKNLPTYSFKQPSWAYLDNIQLADPKFNVSRPIDILFGADIYSSIILEGICRGNQTSPIAQQTRLGWILCGNVTTLQCNVIQIEVDQLRKFWETEEISEQTPLSTDDQECLQLYKSTTTRTLDGRYEVKLPFKGKFAENLGSSKSKAVAQFGHLERKFIKHENISNKYKSFIHEYIMLGHMKPAICNTKPECFLPHHCVLRDDSTTTSLRVVFNASSKTSSGHSLNDLMYKGPNLQQDLQLLILKWRQYQFAFTADIEKMFRQILVCKEDQKLQKIVWRDCPSDRLKEYQLTTVTYGTKAAPFLAMMTLKQLANDERSNYQEAARVLEESFYTDDLLHGAHSIDSALKLKNELIELLKRGGFNLRKWASNDRRLLCNNESDQQEIKSFKELESTKTLGLRWNPIGDNFIFDLKINCSVKNATKRSVLSDISKFFDPLGWLTPVTTKLKILFQKIWTSQIQWDDVIPESLHQEWVKFKADLPQLQQIQIPRWLSTRSAQKIELHGFCDSSIKAYACAIYCKVYHNQTVITLIAGKSKIVPSNKNISLPRLELCGALLLANLMNKVKLCLSDYNVETYGWIDSTAVLGWLQGDPGRWQTFVANRTRKVTEIMPPSCWRYVKSADNPADCASRGLSITQLHSHPLWWQGPPWLPTYEPQLKQPIYTTMEEIKKQVTVVMKQDTDSMVINNLFKHHSSFAKIVNILAWVYRFISRKRNKRLHPYLTLDEIRKAKLSIIKQVQQQEFADEIKSLTNNGKVSCKSKILNLNPYLDETGALRVGGRLRHAHISEEMKHPIIIPHRGPLTELIIDQAHKLTFHGGARLTLSFIRQKYWIVGGNDAAKKKIRLCMKCRKFNPSKQYQIMGDLPEARSNPARPFSHTGIDFTGHILLKANTGRGIKTTKGYVAVFVCMATKAVHLELVSDLSTSAFMAALRRMAARRGTPCHIYSDNGRNFVGANKQIQQELQELQQIFDKQFLAEVTEMEINWHFNAPIWASAGGLWESAVKSFKYHFKRVVGEQKMTFEELSTVLAQIEACLNSRPLCPLTEDPEDLNFLTPAHFLTGGPALTLIETERDLRTRWQLTQRILSDIWKKWRSEYLTQLTTRSKWQQPRENIKLNDIVLLHEDNLPPGKWSMGRVIDLHPGADGYVRVVSLKTKNGVLKRPITKISILPVNQEITDRSEPKHLSSSHHSEHTHKNAKSVTLNKVTLFTSLIFFMAIISAVQGVFRVTKFRQNQSLYFDKLANMQIVRDEWKLVVYYDMHPYWEGIRALCKYTKSLEQTCNTIRNTMTCDMVLLQLNHGITDLEYYNEILLSQQTNSGLTRQRRGLVDGIGYLANSLFGVLDARFAEQYQKDISLLRDNQKQMASYWKNQTSIIEVEYNLLKRTEQTMNRQHKMVTQHILSMENALNELATTTKNISILNDVTLGALIGSNILHNLKSLQSTLLDTITDIYHGNFNPHILTPAQIQSQLSIIASQLPKDVSLPVDDMHTNLNKVYKLLRVKARMLPQYLIFEIRLPLISRDSFEVFKMFSVPQLKGRNMVSIKPIADYVAINLKKDTYTTLTDEALRSCVISEEYLCHIPKPIYQFTKDQDFCLTNQFGCITTTSPCTSSWLEGNTINNYIYFCCDQCPLRIMCEDQVMPHQLMGAGIVAIDSGCIIKAQQFTVTAHKQLSSKLNYHPDVFAPEIPPINMIINISIPHIRTQNHSEEPSYSKELTDIGQRIKIMKESTLSTESISYHDIHHYTVIYCLIGLAAVAGLLFTWRRARAWRVPATPPSAAQAREPQDPPASLPRGSDRVIYLNEQSESNNSASARINKATSPILIR